MAPRFVFDVTGLQTRELSGITRVQLEAASIMADMGPIGVEFCAFDGRDRCYERVAASTVLEMAERMRGRDQSADRQPRAPLRLVPREMAKGMIAKLAGRSPAAAVHVRRFGDHVLRALAEARAAVDAVRADHRGDRRAGSCCSREWSAETTYCSVGMDWADGDLEYLARRRREMGFRVVLTVYDLIPVVTPQYVSSDWDASPHFRQVLGVADLVLVISRATGEDLRSVAETLHLPVPKLVQLPIGSDLLSEVPTVPRQMEEGASRIAGGYVLSVGTVEIRKNHHLLLDVWEMLVSALGREKTPPLVVAGRRGWLATETLARLTRTPSLRGIVSFIEGPTDAELAWLYRNCEFTVFPALYEGWGLPVSESLDFGKMCLTANCSSLPEAGEGLTELLDPFDRMAWKDRILQYWTDRDLLAAREREIQQHHEHVTGTDTTRVLLDLTKSG